MTIKKFLTIQLHGPNNEAYFIGKDSVSILKFNWRATIIKTHAKQASGFQLFCC